MSVQTIMLGALQIDSPAERKKYLDDRCRHNPELRACVEQLLRECEALEHRQTAEGGEAHDMGGQATREPDILEVDFPLLMAEMQEAAEAEDQIADSVKLFDQGLRIRCPHCFNPMELVPDARLVDIHCPSCGSHFSLIDQSATTRDAQVVTQIGHFQLIDRVGTGGFGTVWKARDTILDRVVAVKMPRKGALLPHEVEKFLREARTAAQVRHPNIVTVHEVGKQGDQVYIVSDFIRGTPLSEYLAHRRLSESEAIQFALVLARALHAAHQAGIVHRDMKPHNVIIDHACNLFITDFGLAKREAAEISMTIDGQILGTPAYMSPEQARGDGHRADRRSDIYSLGVILFQMLTGELPFRGSAQMLIHQILNDEVPSPRTLQRQLSRDVETVCLKCLQRDPLRRFASADELAAELERILDHVPIESRPVSSGEKMVRYCRRHPSRAVAVALVGMWAVGGPLGAWQFASLRSSLVRQQRQNTQLIQQSTDERDRLAVDRKSVNDAMARIHAWTEDRVPPEQTLLRGIYQHVEPLVPMWTENAAISAYDRAHLHLGWALILKATAKGDAAIDSLKTAVRLLQESSSDDRPTLACLGECQRLLCELYQEKNTWDDAISAAEDVVSTRERQRKLDPQQLAFIKEHVKSLVTLAQLQQRAGNIESALQTLSLAANIAQQCSIPTLMETSVDGEQFYRLACEMTDTVPLGHVPRYDREHTSQVPK